MRVINEIIVHCAATVEGEWFGVDDVDRWHKERGWKGIGYHWLVYLDGTVHAGRPEAEVGAHVTWHNQDTLGICYIGGLDAKRAPKDTRTPAQKKGLEDALKAMMRRYPSITKITGHNQYANKACPCFDAQAEYLYLFSQSAKTIVLADRLVHAFAYPSFNQHVTVFEGGVEIPHLRDGRYNNDPGGKARWYCTKFDGREMWIHEQDVVPHE